MTTLQYTPPPTVKAFIKHYLPGELFLDWIVGSVGSGKTTGLFFKLCYMAQLQAPSPVDGIRRSRCVIVRSTMPQLNDTTIKSFNYWFKDGQAGKWKATTKDFIMRFGDVECEVMFRPLDTPDDVDRVLSLEVTFAILDEFVQIPQEIVSALSARCGRYPPRIEGGATNWGMWGASNPGMESDWWYAFLEDQTLLKDGEEPTNWKYFKQPSGFSEFPENLDNLPGKDTYYTNLMKGKTQHWIKQFIEVEWGYSMNGKPVFPMFNKDLHVAKKPIQPNRFRPLLIGYDPGMSGGLIIGQYDDSVGRVTVLEEMALENYATDRMISERLKPLLRTKYPDFEALILPDPASSNRSQGQTGASVLIELKRHFAVKEETDNTILPRLESAQYYMMRLTGEGPALQINPHCLNIIRALVSGYKYTIIKGSTRETPDKNSHSHIADAFTYFTRYCRKGELLAGRKAERKSPVIRRPTRNLYNMR